MSESQKEGRDLGAGAPGTLKVRVHPRLPHTHTHAHRHPVESTPLRPVLRKAWHRRAWQRAWQNVNVCCWETGIAASPAGLPTASAPAKPSRGSLCSDTSSGTDVQSTRPRGTDCQGRPPTPTPRFPVLRTAALSYTAAPQPGPGRPEQQARSLSSAPRSELDTAPQSCFQSSRAPTDADAEMQTPSESKAGGPRGARGRVLPFGETCPQPPGRGASPGLGR